MTEIADVLDDLAGDLKAISREPTTGSTESTILGTLARTLIGRAAKVREGISEAADAEERRQAAAAAAAQRDGGAPAYDPAEHTVNEVNDHLRDASPEERARVLDLERQDRPEVPAVKKQRGGILDGPHSQS